jgi:hypothetical protein
VTATGLIINKKPFIVPGLPIQNFLDNIALMLKLPEDGAPRSTTWIRAFVGHTTKGIWPQPLKPGYGPRVDDAAKTNRYWTNNAEAGGAQLIGDRDGDLACMCDVFKTAAYHAGKVNQYTEGLEIWQEQVMVDGKKTGPLYTGQLDNCTTLVDAVTWIFQIQRQTQFKYVGRIPRLAEGGANAVGVYGHRDCCGLKNGHATRGRGDPGDHFYDWLLKSVDTAPDPEVGRPASHFAGYEPVDYATNSDIALWKPRQLELNKMGASLLVDGVAGPATVKAIQRYMPDMPRGLWTVRPIDAVLADAFGNDWRP